MMEKLKELRPLRAALVAVVVVAIYFLAGYVKERRMAAENAERAEVLGGVYVKGVQPELTAIQKEKPTPKIACGSDTTAYVMSQSFVEDRLRAPATAAFPSITKIKVSETGRCLYSVVAYVDAQNGFGALVRTRYAAEMEYLPVTREWRARNLHLFE